LEELHQCISISIRGCRRAMGDPEDWPEHEFFALNLSAGLIFATAIASSTAHRSSFIIILLLLSLLYPYSSLLVDCFFTFHALFSAFCRTDLSLLTIDWAVLVGGFDIVAANSIGR
jgi:hypothetical protein